MAEQLDMFGAGVVRTESMRAEDRRAKAKAQKRPSIDQRWAEFHAANPHVLDELLRLARARLDRGEKRIGLKALWEELRSWLQVTGTDAYKLDNGYTALYARTLIRVDPRLADLIETRKRKAERHP